MGCSRLLSRVSTLDENFLAQDDAKMKMNELMGKKIESSAEIPSYFS